MTRRVTPLGALDRGLLAGVAGTAAMTAWQELSAKLQSSGEEDEGTSEEAKDPWEEASAPAKVGQRIIEGVFQNEVSADKIGTLTNAMHWGYGAGWGAVWLSSYAELVPMGLYEPPWKYAPKELGMDLSYHLAYGGATAAAFGVLSR